MNVVVNALKSVAFSKFDEAVNMYAILFCDKHEYNTRDNYWVSDKPGGVYICGDYAFSFSDMKLDIDNDVEAGKILDWHDYGLEAYSKGETVINYLTWIKLS